MLYCFTALIWGYPVITWLELQFPFILAYLYHDISFSWRINTLFALLQVNSVILSKLRSFINIESRAPPNTSVLTSVGLNPEIIPIVPAQKFLFMFYIFIHSSQLLPCIHLSFYPPTPSLARPSPHGRQSAALWLLFSSGSRGPYRANLIVLLNPMEKKVFFLYIVLSGVNM